MRSGGFGALMQIPLAPADWMRQPMLSADQPPLEGRANRLAHTGEPHGRGRCRLLFSIRQVALASALQAARLAANGNFVILIMVSLCGFHFGQQAYVSY